MKTLIVDDSALYRRFVRNAISEIEGVDVIGHASNGGIAIKRIHELKPDLVVLDIHMPEVDGIGVLKEVKGLPDPPAIIVLSAADSSCMAMTTKALELGAFDFIVKPAQGSVNENHVTVREALRPRIEAIMLKRNLKGVVGSHATCVEDSHASEESSQNDQYPQPDFKIFPPRVLVIGVSTGGPEALMKALPKFPKDFPLPVLVVQHMPKGFTGLLAADLDRACPLQVREASDGDLVEPGNIYLAPGGRQMKVKKLFVNHTLEVNDSPPVRNCCPSVDYLLTSVAETYGAASIVSILTGMGDDGTEGCKLIRQKGGMVVTQDAESCVVYGMPKSVVEAGLSNKVVPLDSFAKRIHDIVSLRREACQH